MRYVEYFRILKSIELIYYKGQKKVCYMVGYNSPVTFCRTFLRVTKLHMSYFLPSRFKENKKIAREVRKLAKQNPKKALEIILMDVAERAMLSK
jgi:AraC-like DNA-binding protein